MDRDRVSENSFRSEIIFLNVYSSSTRWQPVTPLPYHLFLIMEIYLLQIDKEEEGEPIGRYGGKWSR